MIEIVKLHKGRPPLSDITGRLRLLADEIEAGECGNEVTSILIIIPRENDYPTILGFGDVEGRNEPIIQFELAKQKFIVNMMSRT